MLLKNKNYILISIIFTVLYGTYNSFGAVVSSLTKPYYNSEYNAVFGVTFIFSGVTGSFIFGVLLDKY